MSTAIERYRQQLRHLDDWDDYLRAESRLPGPRANLELAQAVADTGDRARFVHLLDLESAFPGGAAMENTPDEYLTLCGVWGLGQLIAKGDRSWYAELQRRAADSRWRIREAAAIALQQAGDADLSGLLDELAHWQTNWYDRRAAVAALAEPRLCAAAAHLEGCPERLVAQFNAITSALVGAVPGERRDPGYKVLRQALGYAWSVIVVGLPTTARPAFEAWLATGNETRDRDLTWMLRENLKKNRLLRLDPVWVDTWVQRLAQLSKNH